MNPEEPEIRIFIAISHAVVNAKVEQAAALRKANAVKVLIVQLTLVKRCLN
ncbi:MAG: hypothetical protein HGB33_10215 [Syntrophaceae bacterium]|nr:hypothetical protein [Syntrophaceae bacterium]NTW78122.1 hypothetical protein [Syntrophaceae bacterium]